MILSLTMNPALDVTGEVSEIIPNEKSYVFNEGRFAGGNGINAGRIAHRLGGKVLLSGFLGGATGDEMQLMLDEEKLSHDFIQISGRTRMNLTISNMKGHEQTRLSFPGPKIILKELKALDRLIKKTNPHMVLIGGSLPPGVSAVKIRNIVSLCHQNSIPVFVDIPGKALKDVLTSGPTLIKPNLTEFQEMTGKKLSSISQVIKAARTFSESIPLQCISSVEGGALLVTPEKAWFGKIPKVKIYSTVGAGDSMVGAMAYSFHRKGAPEELLRWGLAAACATLVNRGLTMGSKTSIRSYFTKIKVLEVS